MATFEGGPRNGPRPRTFMESSVPERMCFAPERRIVDRTTVTHDGWMLVGTAPGAEPPEGAWPGQIEFVLDPDRSNLRASAEDWGTAVYVYDDSARSPGT